MSDRIFYFIDEDGNELEAIATPCGPPWSVSIGRDDQGNLIVHENGELVTDDTRAVELYGTFGGAIGWSIMDAVEEAFDQTDKPAS